MKKTLLLTIAALITAWSAMAQQYPNKDWQAVAGDVTYSAADLINIHIAGAVDKEYDRLELSTGTLTPGGATLNVFPCYTPTPGDRFVIFKAPTIDGEFSNPPLIDAGGNFFVLSYEKENGEDIVVLTVVAKLFGIELITPGTSSVQPDYKYTLQIDTEPDGRGAVSASKTEFSVCDDVYINVDPIPITVPAFVFTHWSQEGGAVIENTASKTTSATMPARNVKLTANFQELAPVPLAVSGTFTAADKIYDGTITATMSINNLQLVGFSDLRGDQVTLTDIVLHFDNAGIGTDKVVHIASATLSGKHAGNYTLDLTGAPTTAADILAKQLTISGSFTANNKTYDGTTVATGDVKSLTLDGIVSPDDVSIGVVTITFDYKAPGTHSVTITAASLDGADAGNYTLSLTGAPAATANISTKELTIGGSFTADNKTYDGTTAATGDANNLTLAGIVSPDVVSIDVVTLTFASKDAGTHSVTITAASLKGAAAGNYTLHLAGAPTTAADISAKQLTIGGSFSAHDKIYDGTIAATIDQNDLSLDGIVNPDNVSIGVVTITFDSKAAGTHSVTITAASLDGADAGNYTLSLDGAPITLAKITCPASVAFDYRGQPVTYGVVERGGLCWMDRNLGAIRVPTSMTDSEGYGDLFQWGRLDDGHQDRQSGSTSTLSNTDVPGHDDFITVNSVPYDWRSPHNDDLWQGGEGINNPCPPGWRVPTEAELNAELQSWGSNDSEGAYASTLKWPVGGYRGLDGTLKEVGSSGNVWSSDSGRGLVITYLYAVWSTTGRANGMSVRCVKD